MPRPAKLTPEVQATIVSSIRSGNYAVVACQAAGIGSSTYYHWLDDPRPMYRDFREAIEKASAQAEQRNVAIIMAEAPTTWQAAAWMLERQHFDRWGRKERRELSGPDGGKIELALIDEILAEAGMADGGRRELAAPD